MASKSANVEWSEGRNHVLFFVKGEKTQGGWVFMERSTWEVVWYPVAAALIQQCIERAEKELGAFNHVIENPLPEERVNGGKKDEIQTPETKFVSELTQTRG